MLTNATFSFIGFGVMGEAMIRGILAQRLIEPEAITASDPLPDRLQTLHGRYGIARPPTTWRRRAPAPSPSSASSRKRCPPTGDPSGNLRRQPGDQRRRRRTYRAHPTWAGCGENRAAMPNTPVQIGHGMTVWTATHAVDEVGQRQAQAILGALGKEILVDDEGYLEMATVLSGTGPAYVFLFMEALIDAGVHMGFSRRVAEELVYQTIEGSVVIAVLTVIPPQPGSRDNHRQARSPVSARRTQSPR